MAAAQMGHRRFVGAIAAWVVAVVPLVGGAAWEWPEDRRVGEVAFSADGTRLATLSFGPDIEAQLRVFDLNNGGELRGMRRSTPIDLLGVSADGRDLVPVPGGPSLAELSRWPWTALLQNHGTDEGMFTVAPDGRTVAEARPGAEDDGSEPTILLWELPNGRALGTLEANEPIRALAFAPDGRTLAVVGDHLRLWDLARRSLRDGPHAGEFYGRPVAFTPDGKAIAIHKGGAYRVLDAATGEPKMDFPCVFPQEVAFTPDGRRLVGIENDGATAWDVATGAEVARFDGHRVGNLARWRNRAARTAKLDSLGVGPNPVWAVAVAPDGRTVATGDHFGKVWLWDIATGRPLLRLDHTRDRVPRAWKILAWIWPVAWLGGRALRRSRRRDVPAAAASTA